MSDHDNEEEQSESLLSGEEKKIPARPKKKKSSSSRRTSPTKSKPSGGFSCCRRRPVKYNNGFKSENDFDEQDPHRWLRFLLLEFISTYLYVMVSAGSVLSTGALTFQWDINEQSPGRMLCIAFAQGFIYCALLYSSTSFLDNKLREDMEIIKTHDKYPEFRDWPVGYFNPALTLACAITRTRNNFEKKLVTQISWMVTFIYSVVQIIAGVAAGITLHLMLYDQITTVGRASLGATLPGDGTTVWNVYLMETLSTFVVVLAQLMFLIRGERLVHHYEDNTNLHLTKHAQKGREARGYVKDAAPFVLGLIVVVMTCMSLATSGASMNPARSFGVAVVSGQWENHWVYWAGPYSGALLAGVLFKFMGAFPKIEESKGNNETGFSSDEEEEEGERDDEEKYTD